MTAEFYQCAAVAHAAPVPTKATKTEQKRPGRAWPSCAARPSSQYPAAPCAPAALLQGLALPALGRARQLVGRPVMLVEFERDHLGSIVPGDGLQTHRGPVRPSRHRPEEGI